MKKLLGNKSQYNDQTNDALVEFTKDYTDKKKIVSCFCNSFADALETGHYPNVFTPGAQIPDILMMIMHNNKNLKLFLEARDINTDEYPPNEIPQFYPVLADILFGKGNHNITFGWGLSYGTIRQHILENAVVIGGGKFPCGGHIVPFKGFNDDRHTLNYNDSYPANYANRKGYNRIMDQEMFKIMSSWKVVVPEWDQSKFSMPKPIKLL